MTVCSLPGELVGVGNKQLQPLEPIFCEYSWSTGKKSVFTVFLSIKGSENLH